MRVNQILRGDVRASLIKLTVFIFVTLFAITVLANTIRGSSKGNSDNGYSALFTDATMAAPGDDVRIAGVVVGRVTKVELADRDKARVRFELDGDRSLPTTTHATLKFRNLIGQRYLALSREPGPIGAELARGSTIGLEHTTPAVDLTALFNGFRPLFTTLQPADVNALANSLVAVLQGEGGTVTSLIKQTGELTSTLADRDQVIGQVIDNLTAVLRTINDRDVQFQQLVVTTRQLVEGLAQDRTAVGGAVDSLAALTSAAENVVAATRPQVTDSLAALNTVSLDVKKKEADLDAVLRTMPIKTDKLIRMGSFGSWFQFYLCGLDVMTGPGHAPNLLPPPVGLVNQPIYTNAAPRCNGAGAR